jgi:2-oxo-3-hexenedioate decarboxylase
VSVVGDAVALLRAAEEERTGCAPLTQRWDLDLVTAYRIQDALLAERVERGEQIVGVKLGFTSRARQEAFGATQPLVAWLTDAMALPDGASVPLDRLIHPAAEPELAFLVERRLEGPGVTAADALAAVSLAFGAIDVVDSRYRGAPAVADLIADNGSGAFFRIGARGVPVRDIDLLAEAVRLEQGGDVVGTGTGAAILGDPAAAVAAAANVLAERSLALEAGWLVLAGTLVDPVQLVAGAPLVATFTELGSVALAT